MDDFDSTRLEAILSSLQTLPRGGLDQDILDSIFDYCLKKDGLVCWEFEAKYCYTSSDVAMNSLRKIADRAFHSHARISDPAPILGSPFQSPRVDSFSSPVRSPSYEPLPAFATVAKPLLEDMDQQASISGAPLQQQSLFSTPPFQDTPDGPPKRPVGKRKVAERPLKDIFEGPPGKRQDLFGQQASVKQDSLFGLSLKHPSLKRPLQDASEGPPAKRHGLFD
ncbi:hypothetical protein BJX99DRAFT_265604 [Aspergillus californicus]